MRMNEKVSRAGAEIPDWLCLSDHTSESNMDLYLAVDKEVDDAENVTLSGKFPSKVYEGNFENTGEWCQDFEAYAKARAWKSRNGTCGIPPSPPVPKSTGKTI
ncbi:MAG: hypothetical protein NHB15_07625 [Methanosarcina barkeri]|nr:hypothetical protein [Methanosarcina sp. ERenArc_MAG2]